MPWIFNAAWKIIKTWLSAEAIAKIKFVTKSDIHTYIEKRFLFPHLGGQVGDIFLPVYWHFKHFLNHIYQAFSS